MLQITFLFIGTFILVLVLATIFKRYQRAILWAAAICMLLGVLFSVGFGYVDVIDGNRPNMPVITAIIFAMAEFVILIIGAEKLHKELREKGNNSQTGNKVIMQSSEETSCKVVLPERLNTELANKVFAQALEAGLYEIRRPPL